MATLSELLPPEGIRLDTAASGWREAVRAAGELMTATGTSTQAYTTAIVDNVEENGPYIVIAPGFALAHARPSPAVLRTGMSWVRLSEPVEFGHESNDPVDLVVGLAARSTAEHQAALAALARLLADPAAARALHDAPTPAALRTVLAGDASGDAPEARAAPAAGESEESGASAEPPGPGEGEQPQEAGETEEPGGSRTASATPDVHRILTVCGNGLGTSLFLKSTLEQVLERWKWSRYVSVEATDTVSARGRAGEAVAVLTSREIARTLGDVGIPVCVIEDFTSAAEADGALREIYDV